MMNQSGNQSESFNSCSSKPTVKILYIKLYLKFFKRRHHCTRCSKLKSVVPVHFLTLEWEFLKSNLDVFLSQPPCCFSADWGKMSAGCGGLGRAGHSALELHLSFIYFVICRLDYRDKAETRVRFFKITG